jgi:hypothetical protein
MHQLNQNIPQQQQMISPQQNLAIQQEIAAMQAAAANANLNGNQTTTNPLLNGCTAISTMVTNTNINVTYLNGAIGKYHDNKMHQGFIAVLKVKIDFLTFDFKSSDLFFCRTISASLKHWNMIRRSFSTLAILLATLIIWSWVRRLNIHCHHHATESMAVEIVFQLKMFAYYQEVCHDCKLFE